MPKNRPTKINWSEAKKDYVSNTTTSLDDIAEKYGVAKSTILARAAEEKWTETRKQVILKTDQRLIEKIIESNAEYKARKFRDGQILSELGITVLQEKMDKIGTKVAGEIVATGHKLQSEALDLDKPTTQVNIQNNIFTVSDLVRQMQEKRRERNG